MKRLRWRIWQMIVLIVIVAAVLPLRVDWGNLPTYSSISYGKFTVVWLPDMVVIWKNPESGDVLFGWNKVTGYKRWNYNAFNPGKTYHR